MSTFFSICIPQYNRTSFVVEAIRSIGRQRFRDCEICVSDDGSTDGRVMEVRAALEATGLPFRFHRRMTNGRYDKNLRSAMELASGEYLFLLGNDDALKDDATLERLADLLTANPDADVLLPNFEDYQTGAVTRRVDRTALLDGGPRTAVAVFRKFSFVSGVVLRRRPAEQVRTEAWDGTEMYQMYVGCRLVAAGGAVLEAEISAIRKDIAVVGEAVDSFAAKPREVLRGVPVQTLPVSRVAALVAAAIGPHVGPGRARERIFATLMIQYYGFLYPYWLFVYRRVQSWRYAAGVARAFVPTRSLAGARVPPLSRLVAWCGFALSTVIGLFAPVATSSLLFRPARRAARAAAVVGRSAVRT